MTFIVLSLMMVFSVTGWAGACPKTLHAYRGATPVLDGYLSPGEYDDAESFTGTQDWNRDAEPVTDLSELSMRGWVKHDGENLYFAFEVTDDVIYGFDIERWAPAANPDVHELTQDGWPWFGDSIEIMMNPPNDWNPDSSQGAVGDGTGWQMVCSSHKSRAGGIGVGGMLEGEPRSSDYAWNTYVEWLSEGHMQAATRLKSAEEGRGYIIEWMIRPDPCLEISPGVFWNDGMGVVNMGINFEVQDVDEKERGEGNWSNMHHIEHWADHPKSQYRSFGTLVMDPESMPGAAVANRAETSVQSFVLHQNSPNPFNPRTAITFSLELSEPVTVEIYNMNGQIVRTLVDNIAGAGSHTVVWNGMDAFGRRVSTGQYFYRLRAGEYAETRKMLLVK